MGKERQGMCQQRSRESQLSVPIRLSTFDCLGGGNREKVGSLTNYGGGEEGSFKWRVWQEKKNTAILLARDSFSHTYNTLPHSRDTFSIDATCL